MPPNTQFDVTLPTDPYIESAFPALDRTMKRAIVSALDTGKLLPNDLKVSNNAVTPLKKVDVSGSGLIVSDGTGLWMLDAVSVTADVTVAGLNGLDTGVQAASTTYYVYVIFNGTTIGSLLSISNSAPTMPTGYTFKKRVGSNTTDASTNFSAGWVSDIPVQFSFNHSQTTVVDVTNTVTETNLYSVSIPQNTLLAGRYLQVVFWGDLLDNAAGTYDIRVKLGATTLFDSGAISVTQNAARQVKTMRVDLFAIATNSQITRTVLEMATGAAIALLGSTPTSVNTGPSALLGEIASTEDNGAGARTLVITGQWSVASTSLSVRALGVKTTVFP
jgi:hypothetical protein